MPMKSPLQFKPKEKTILKNIQTFASSKNKRLYLVGGAVRDLLLGRSKGSPDFDFAVKRGAIDFGRKLAAKMKAGFVVLDKKHGACRLVKGINGLSYTFDFTDFRGKDIAGDLLRRDFTINSVALELADAIGNGDLRAVLLDPCAGIEDIEAGLINVPHKDSFSDDPLRILRAFSFSAIFGFKIDKTTLALAKKHRAKLDDVSFERIRDELFKIFEAEGSYKYLIQLDKLKILEVIFPEIKKMRRIGKGAYHHLDVWGHTLEAVKQIEEVYADLAGNEDIRSYLDEVISPQRRRRALIKLGAFLHDIGKPKSMRRLKGKLIFHGHERIGLGMTRQICRRLKISNAESAALEKMVLWHLRPGYLGDTAAPTERAKFRYFRDAGSEAISILLLSLADQRSTLGPLTTKKSRVQHEKVCNALIREYYRKEKVKKPERILNGNEVMRAFGLKPSKLIGKILAEVEELQAIGKVRTKQEALKVASRMIK